MTGLSGPINQGFLFAKNLFTNPAYRPGDALLKQFEEQFGATTSITPEIKEGLSSIQKVLENRVTGASQAHNLIKQDLRLLLAGGSADFIPFSETSFNNLTSTDFIRRLEARLTDAGITPTQTKQLKATLNLIEQLKAATDADFTLDKVIGELAIAKHTDLAGEALGIAKNLEKATERLASAFGYNDFEPEYSSLRDGKNPRDLTDDDFFTEPKNPYKVESYFPKEK